MGDNGGIAARRRMGKRSTYLSALQLAVADDPDAVREEFVAVGAIPFAKGVIAAMEPGPRCAECGQVAHHGERWAFRLFAEVAGWAHAEQTVVQALIVQLGGSLERARYAVDLLEGTPEDVHAIYRECKAMCEWYEGQSWDKGGEHGSGATVEPDVDRE